MKSFTTIVLVTSALELAAQNQPVFQVESNLVVIRTQVIDRETRQPVIGLTRSDFQVFDESSEAEITVFDDSPVPLNMLLLIDVSGGYTNQLINSCSIALRKSLTRDDRLALMSFSDGTPKLRAEFTNEEDAVMRGWDLVFGKDRNNGMRAVKSSRMFDAVRGAAEHLLRTRKLRRPAIVVVTHNREARSATKQNFALETLLESSATLEAVVLPQETGSGGFRVGGMFRGRSNPTSRGSTAAKFLEDLGSIEPFTTATGGQTLRLDLDDWTRSASANGRDSDWAATTIGPLVKDLMSRLRSQYTLAVRGSTVKERQFRRLSVRLTDKAKANYPTAVVSARSGYWTASNESSVKK